MKNTSVKLTRKIAAMIAAVTAVSAMAVSASATDAENEDIIKAAQANPDLQATWEDVEQNEDNEDEIDQVYDLLERFNIWGSVCNGSDANEYEDENGKLTHEQVLDLIANAHPDGCLQSPYSMDFGYDDDEDFDDEDEEPVFTKEDWENAGSDDEDDDDEGYIFEYEFDGDLMGELLGNIL